jgi:precorrin-6B methylase 2
MNKKHTPEIALCSRKDIEMAWNISQNPNNNNVYRRYITNPKKNKQYRIIDMGAYCVLNDITPDLLRVFVESGKRILDVIAGDDDAKKKNNKVVVMSEEEYKSYEIFKKIKAFDEVNK